MHTLQATAQCKSHVESLTKPKVNRSDILFFGGSCKWHESSPDSYLHSWHFVENSSEKDLVLGWFRGLELRQLMRHCVIRGQDALRTSHTFLSSCCERKLMFGFWRWKSTSHQVARDKCFILEHCRLVIMLQSPNLNRSFAMFLDGAWCVRLGNDPALRGKCILPFKKIFLNQICLCEAVLGHPG